MTPAATSRSAASWAAGPGVATTPIETSLRAHDRGQVADRADADAADHGADLGRVVVDDAGDREAALAEPAVAGERLAEVAGADDHDGPVVGEAELAAHLVDEVLDLVADAAGAVRAEVAEVLAHLRRVDAGEIGELLATRRWRCPTRTGRAGSAGRRGAGRPSPPGSSGLGSSSPSASTLSPRAPVHKVVTPGATRTQRLAAQRHRSRPRHARPRAARTRTRPRVAERVTALSPGRSIR